MPKPLGHCHTQSYGNGRIWGFVARQTLGNQGMGFWLALPAKRNKKPAPMARVKACNDRQGFSR